MGNFGDIIFSIFFLLNLANIYVWSRETSMPVKFAAKYGGLTGQIAFGRDSHGENWFPTVMLATTNWRTFLVNGGKKLGCADWHQFCREHLIRYIPDEAGTTSQTSPLVGPLTDNGIAVMDNILFPQYMDRPLMQKIALMNEKIDNNQNFWGNRRDKIPPEVNLANGCLSLMPGVPEDEPNFGENTPLQNFIEQFPDETFISIRLENFDESSPPKYNTPQMPIYGSLSLGKMESADKKCVENGNKWNNVKVKNSKLPWTLQIEGIEVDGVQRMADKRMALIDSGSEFIHLPKDIWADLKEKFALNEGKCNWQMPPLEFHINGVVYSVPPQHYLRKERENVCSLLLGPNLENEDGFRLGLPFLRSTCVGLDLRTKEVWLSGGPGPKVNGAKLTIPSMAAKFVAIFAIFSQIFFLNMFF